MLDGPRSLIILNPVSGKRQNERLIDDIKGAFPFSEIILTTHKGHPYEIANEEDLNSFSALIAIGGDGTMHEVINGMMDRKDDMKIPIGLIPGGTGNSFMHDLGCLDPQRAIRIIKEGNLKAIDLAEIKMKDGIRHAYNIVGWGISVTINNLAEKWRKVGGQRYNLAALYEIIRNPKWPVKINLDGNIIEGSFSFFLACNTMYSGNGMKVAPRAVLDDGLIDIILLRQAPRRKLIGLFSKIFDGRHINSPLIEYHQVRSFSIIPEKDTVLNIDGQVEGHTPVSVTVLPKAIQVFYPK
jgi:sphingosine kinase